MILQHGNRNKAWVTKDNISVKGYCYDRSNTLCAGESLAGMFSEPGDVAAFVEKMAEANGLFCVVAQLPGCTILASDRSRTYPLFYRIVGKELMVSDDPALLRREDEQIIPEAETEMLCSSVVFGSKTLIEGIYQVPPSTVVVWCDGEISEHVYSHYATARVSELTYDEEKKRFEEALMQTFERLVRSANGRQIVVPLSGGFDSRLIAAMLKKTGYKNVLCYNTGRPDNPEMRLSKLVAERLGFPYVFVDSSDEEKLKSYEKSDEFEQYFRFSGACCGIFWMYEYFAVRELRDKNRIEKDAVFVPGHSGDFLAGSQITKAGLKENASESEIVSTLLVQKFPYGDAKKSGYLGNYMANFVTEIVNENPDYLPYSVYEEFDYREKLPKLINNSCRIYEFFGYDVRLPFWDRELLQLFQSMIYENKLYKKLYDDYLKEVLFADYNLNFGNELQPGKYEIKKQQIKNIIKRYVPMWLKKMVVSDPDYTCMKEISAPLRRDLEAAGVPIGTTYNEIFVKWYLLKLKEELRVNG